MLAHFCVWLAASYTVSSQSEQIWSSSLTNQQSLSEWNTDWAGDISQNSSICPDPNMNCYTGFARDDLWIYIDPGRGYRNLTLHALIRLIDIDSNNGEFCGIYYNQFATDYSSWQLISRFASSNTTTLAMTYMDIALPHSADNNPTFGLAIHVNSSRNSSMCTVQNVSLRGTICNESDIGREVVWSSSLTTNMTDWQYIGDVSIQQSNICPDTSLHPLSCCVLETDETEIYRYDSTVGYHSIDLDLWIKPSVHSSCSLWFITDRKSDNPDHWEPLHDNITNHELNETQYLSLHLPDYADDNEVVGIALYSWYGRCGVSHVTMTGIPISNGSFTSNSNLQFLHWYLLSAVMAMTFIMALVVVFLLWRRRKINTTKQTVRQLSIEQNNRANKEKNEVELGKHEKDENDEKEDSLKEGKAEDDHQEVSEDFDHSVEEKQMEISVEEDHREEGQLERRGTDHAEYA